MVRAGGDRHRGPSCSRWCDTDFLGTDGSGGGTFPNARDLAVAVLNQLPADADPTHLPLAVCTGGEPLLQLDRPLIDALYTLGFNVAVETNGTLAVPEYMGRVNTRTRIRMAASWGCG